MIRTRVGIFRVIFLLIVLVSLAGGRLLVGDEKTNVEQYLQGLAGEGIVFAKRTGHSPVYPSNTDVVAFNTYDIVPWIRGYAGPIKVLVALDSKGIIRGIRIIEHNETKNYVHYMLTRAYLSQFIGKKVTDPFKIGLDVDGISRATVSVKALARTIKEASRQVAIKQFKIQVPEAEGSSVAGLKFVIYLAFFIIVFSFYFVTRKSRTLLRYRRLILTASLVVMGIYIATPFSIIHIFNILLGNYSTSLLWVALILTMLFAMIVAGRFYCGWLCPFGAVLELMDALKVKKWKIPEDIDQRLRILKYILLLLITPVVLISGRADYAVFEPYLTLFSFHGNLLLWALVFLMLTINLRVKRLWCRYLCPVAAVLGLFALSDKGYRSLPGCPMANPQQPHISECIRCNLCYGSSTSDEV